MVELFRRVRKDIRKVTQFTQKYTLVQFFDDVKEGDEYLSSNWPLHSTVVDTFAIDWSVDQMMDRLKELLGEHATASSQAEDDMYFGVSGQIQVVLIRRTESLMKLHMDVLAMLDGGGLVLNDPQFARDGFLPHATVQNNARLRNGDEIKFKSLSVIDMFPGGDPCKRKVLKTIKIGSQSDR